MDANALIDQGNALREQNRPWEALNCYGQAFLINPDHFSAWNNYGNVLRELGQPRRAIPFLQHAMAIDPSNTTAPFNLAVAHLLAGDYRQGWPAYESRWNFEHLAGTLPKFDRPRWQGEDIKGKTLLLIGEQGLGDSLQFARYALAVSNMGTDVALVVPQGLVTLLRNPQALRYTLAPGDALPEFDYWAPLMSLPGIFGQTLDNFQQVLHYVSSRPDKREEWRKRLGTKNRLRIGISWSGRRDTWINRHKSVPVEHIADLIRRHPNHQWVNLQVEALEDEMAFLADTGLESYPGTIQDMSDTAALLDMLDLVISVDSSVTHLAGAMGRPCWVMLNNYAVDWRWLLDRDDSPWYPSARLFRQPAMGEWRPVIDQISRWIELFKI
jgi:hypothetical protein